ncbi:FAD-binding oxidoreductase [Marinobacterium sp. D7]|uniref:NAD(P)/FAD-dependent oxidoreductase n=1 Tax=Marinobacterium ramblicola TaxID=2849041 RepID=UPI001C2CF8DB|nr:FAD-dependent oxidoreductase [Marinobacterium ramblicola]MBV1790179.1 FAD-binding oxidoreductase [Marinobacterium ramblicola]
MKTENISLWMEQADELRVERARLMDDMETDIAIIGAGFTGLWTAYYLKKLKPDLRIALFEQRCVGYGASGRNGGWLLGQMLGEEVLLQRLPRTERTAYQNLIKQIPDQVAQVLAEEGIDCGYHKGGGRAQPAGDLFPSHAG